MSLFFPRYRSNLLAPIAIVQRCAAVMRTKVVSPAIARSRGRSHSPDGFRNNFTSVAIEVKLLLS